MCGKISIRNWFIEPKTEIVYLVINLHIGNKRSKGEFRSVINVDEEIISVDSGLPKKVRRNEAKIRHWKEEWKEEID